jgi:hypothetical protein
MFARQRVEIAGFLGNPVIVEGASKKWGETDVLILHRYRRGDESLPEMYRLQTTDIDKAGAEAMFVLNNDQLFEEEWERTNCLVLVVSSKCMPGHWVKVSLPGHMSREDHRAGLAHEVRSMLGASPTEPEYNFAS